jgi:hypothetical protein
MTDAARRLNLSCCGWESDGESLAADDVQPSFPCEDETMLSACKSLPVALILATAGGLALARGPAPAASGLSPAEFKELKAKLDIKNQPWASIPWKYSLTKARRLAAATRKPIFMVVNTGNILGCV